MTGSATTALPAVLPRAATKPLRVLFFVFAFPPEFSGATIQAIELARALRHHGVTSTFLAQTEDRSLPVRVESDGFTVRRLFRRTESPHAFGLRLARTLAELRDEFDLLFFVGNPGEFWTITYATLAARALGKRVHVELNMEFYDGDPLRIRNTRLETLKSRVARSVERYLPNSAAILSTFPTDLAGTNVTLLPYGLDLERFRPARGSEEVATLRRRLGLPLDRPVVVSAAAVTARKNVDFVLRAWRRVLERRSANPPLLLWLGPLGLEGQGHDASFARSVVAEAQREPLRGHVRFEGAVDDVASYLRAADLFVFASRQEGSPSAVREAMATALPVVVLDLGEITRELIEDGVDGRVVPVRDRATFVAWRDRPYDEPAALDLFIDHVVRLLDDRALARSLGDAARARARERFSIEARARRWLGLTNGQGRAAA